MRRSFRVTPPHGNDRVQIRWRGGQLCAPPRPIHRFRELPIQLMPDDATKIRRCSAVLVVHLRYWSWRNFLRGLTKQNERWQFMLQIVPINVTCVALRDDGHQWHHTTPHHTTRLRRGFVVTFNSVDYLDAIFEFFFALSTSLGVKWALSVNKKRIMWGWSNMKLVEKFQPATLFRRM